MKEGDLITTYYAGYFRLKRIERRFYTEDYIKYFPSFKDRLGEEYSSLYHFVQEFDSNGNLKKSKEKSCDAMFCNLASEKIKTELIELQNKEENLKKLLFLCG